MLTTNFEAGKLDQQFTDTAQTLRSAAELFKALADALEGAAVSDLSYSTVLQAEFVAGRLAACLREEGMTADLQNLLAEFELSEKQ